MSAGASGEAPLVEIHRLRKRYRVGFWMRPVEAVRDVSLQVRRGECVGLIGPNGAGKTTTIKCLLTLVHPTAGRLRLFGEPPGPRTLRRVGFLPENPYFYPNLRPRELLEACAVLSGLRGRQARQRAEALLEQVGIAQAADRPVRRLSKGMQQRLGLAQALLHEPELLVLDEPMSGLDPIGRHQVRELLRSLHQRGVTLLVSSHILSDVEQLCDRVVVVHEGRVRASGPVADVLRPRLLDVQVTLEDAPEGFERSLPVQPLRLRRQGRRLQLWLSEQAQVQRLLRHALQQQVVVEAVEPRRESLEDRFVRATQGSDETQPEAPERNRTQPSADAHA